MKSMKIGAVVAAALLTVVGSSRAAMYTLSDLMDGNDVVTVGDKNFSDWGFGSIGGGPLTAANVGVDITYSGNDYFLSFSGLFNARNGAAYDYQLYYSVATVNGAPTITAIDQRFNLTAGGTGGFIGIGETVFDAPMNSPNAQSVAQSSVGLLAGVGDLSDPPGETLQGDQLVINPALAKVWVTKDIALEAEQGGSVGVTILTQSFHQSVPDGGATLSLLGIALAGAAMVRRFFCA